MLEPPARAEPKLELRPRGRPFAAAGRSTLTCSAAAWQSVLALLRLRSQGSRPTPCVLRAEVIMQEYGPVADEWSVGMLMYQLLTGVFPFWESVQNVSLQQVG